MLDYFKNKSVYSIDEIKWWLDINLNIHDLLFLECSCGSIYDGLPCICPENNEQKIYKQVYRNLSELAEYHKYEYYANCELFQLQKVYGSKIKIREWIIKNEKLCSDFLADFLVYHLNDDTQTNDIVAYQDFENNIHINIKRTDFENLIKFKKSFDFLYYEKELYPEGIEKIDELIKLLATSHKRQLRH